MEWIKIEDRIPEKLQRVLVTCNCGSKEAPYFIVTIGVCVNHDGKLEWSDEDIEYDLMGDVVAWMPLPKPFVEPYNIEQFETTDCHYWQIRQ
jgi:hypothetical protein